ncbi:MAG: conjugal transfer protein TraF [Planctomycetota bacterium]|jgi:hypothetical protein|nr:conjugal transfer protein TraF [Planctomycetota bacterium]
MTSSARAVLLLSTLAAVGAAERHYTGPRGVAMAGANVASANPMQAQTYNQAVLGFLRWDQETNADQTQSASENAEDWVVTSKYGMTADLSAGVQFQGDLQPTLDAIQAAEANLKEVEASGLSALETQSYITLIERLAALETNTLSVDGDANLVVTGRRGNWALGGQLWFDTTGFVTDADLSNLALNTANALAAGLNNNAAELIKGDPNGYEISRLSSDQVANLRNAGYSEDAVRALDSQLLGISPETQEKLVDAVAQLPLAELDSLADNQTRVTLASLMVFEIPVSYGYAFNEYISVGGSLKAMYGVVGGREIQVFDPETSQLLFETGQNTTESFQGGLDLSLLARWEWLRAGLTGRNLNEPTFDSPELLGRATEDITIDRNITTGIAIDPLSWITTELSVDLVDYHRLNTRDDWQALALAVELRPLKQLALRGAYSTNITSSEDRSEDEMITLGIGYTGSTVQFELAAGLGTNTVTYDDITVPTGARLSLGFGVAF